MTVTINQSESPLAGYQGPDWDPDTTTVDGFTTHRTLRWGDVYTASQVDPEVRELGIEIARLTAENEKLAGETGTLDALRRAADTRERAIDAQVIDLERRRADSIAQGQAAADGLVTRGRTTADQIVADAQRRATGIIRDADQKATDVVRDARQLADEYIEEATAQALDINPVPADDIEAEAGWVLEQDDRVRAKALAQQTAATAALALLGGEGLQRVAVAVRAGVERGRAPELTAGDPVERPSAKARARTTG